MANGLTRGKTLTIVSIQSAEGGDPSDASVVNLVRALDAHVAAEGDTIAAYRRLANASHDPVIVALMRLLIEEEERHHEVFRRMAGQVRADLNGGQGQAPARRAVGPETVEAIRAFIQQEQTGALRLRALASDQRALYGGFFGLLLELMAMDSEKHAYILRFVAGLLADTDNAGEDRGT